MHASPARILVVEGDPSAARFAEYVLGTWQGFEVVCVSDPGVALTLIKGEHWDLVIADVDLPRMDGLQLLAAVREVAPALPFALVTVLPTIHRVTAALRLHADDFIAKPVRPVQLIEAATRLTERARR
jgi:DNA-binding response OmpR family regulator